MTEMRERQTTIACRRMESQSQGRPQTRETPETKAVAPITSRRAPSSTSSAASSKCGICLDPEDIADRFACRIVKYGKELTSVYICYSTREWF